MRIWSAAHLFHLESRHREIEESELPDIKARMETLLDQFQGLLAEQKTLRVDIDSCRRNMNLFEKQKYQEKFEVE